MRFPGFEGEWEKYKLGDIMTFKVTNSFSRDDLNYETGSIKNIHYGDIHTKFQALFDITKEVVPYINKEIDLERISDENYCKEGDIIFTDASEDLNGVGKSIEIVNVNKEKLLSGSHTLLARPVKNIFHLGFNGYLFKSNQVRTQIQKESQGTKVLSINVGRISKIILDIPPIQEQRKIASFLTLVDEKIRTQNKIIKELSVLKSGVSKKIFFREWRLKDENGIEFPMWKKMKLRDITIKKSSNIAANKIEDNFGKYIIYGASGILKYVDFYEEENDYIGIVKDGAGVGRIFYCKGKSSVLATMDIIKPEKNLNTYFLYCLLDRINYKKYITGSTIPHIYFKDYRVEKVGVPCLEEQTKIANFLSSIDTKIDVEAQLLQKLEEQKKYLLQHLFC